MACPECGCKVTYPAWNPFDITGEFDDVERCANCGYTFDLEEAIEEDDGISNDEDYDNESDESK